MLYTCLCACIYTQIFQLRCPQTNSAICRRFCLCKRWNFWEQWDNILRPPSDSRFRRSSWIFVSTQSYTFSLCFVGASATINSRKFRRSILLNQYQWKGADNGSAPNVSNLRMVRLMFYNLARLFFPSMILGPFMRRTPSAVREKIWRSMVKSSIRVWSWLSTE